MKVTVIGGADHGRAADISREIYERALSAAESNTADMWLLPAGITSFCDGCGKCFAGEPNKCRHAREVMPIRKSMLSSDVILFVTPAVSGHAPAEVVNFLNYLVYMQIGYSPLPEMMTKRVVAISLGDKRAAEDIADCARLWGVSDVKALSYSERVETLRLLTAPAKKPGFFARLRLRRLAKKAGVTLPDIVRK